MAIYIQFEQSSRLVKLISEFQQVFTPTYAIAKFIQDYMDLDTALGQGLDFWGEKLGLNRNFEFLITNDKTKFGFKGADLGNYSRSNFAKITKTQTFLMPDEMYRKYLKLILLRLVTQPTGFGLTTFITYFYPEASITEENLKVTIDFTKYVEMPDWERRFLSSKTVVPIPAGVTYIPRFYVPGGSNPDFSPGPDQDGNDGNVEKYFSKEEATVYIQKWTSALQEKIQELLFPCIPILQAKGDESGQQMAFQVYSLVAQLENMINEHDPANKDQTGVTLTIALRNFKILLPALMKEYEEKYASEPEVLSYIQNFIVEMNKILVY